MFSTVCTEFKKTTKYTPQNSKASCKVSKINNHNLSASLCQAPHYVTFFLHLINQTKHKYNVTLITTAVLFRHVSTLN